MGDPRKARKKYEKPKHPWRSDALEEERGILNEFGLKNKKELWKMKYLLRGYRRQARRLLALRTEQAKKEEKQLLDRMRRLGLVGESVTLEDVLALKVGDILNRRLQTIVRKKGLANTPGQARQFVVHGHISIGSRRIKVPSYLVKKDEEGGIRYTEGATVGALIVPKTEGEKAPEAGVKTEEAE